MFFDRFRSKSKRKFHVELNTLVNVRADGPFLVKDDQGTIIGPFNASARILTFQARSQDFQIFAEQGVEWTVKTTSYGEKLDLTPIEIPIEFQGQETMEQMLQRMVTDQFSKMAVAAGDESFEEWDDFGPDDDEETLTPYEMVLMNDEYVTDREGDRGEIPSILDSRPETGSSGDPESPPEDKDPEIRHTG